MKTIELYLKYDKCIADDVVHELGYQSPDYYQDGIKHAETFETVQGFGLYEDCKRGFITEQELLYEN